MSAGVEESNVELPAGCWSDDTQLRMAVSRAIGCHGFDVEAFARVEVPIWRSYALGGGRATKAAAANLGKPKSLWYANTFRGWIDAGGNGAAMRVQPHVWASSDLDGGYMLDVITDSVCTHGHPRAIVGACFHAATLAHCLRDGAVPGPSRWEEIAGELDDAPSLIEGHRSLGPTWVALWEQETGKRLRDAWRRTVDELRTAIGQVADGANGTDSTSEAYRGISARLGLTDKAQRGSGILTPVAAVALAATAADAHDAAVVAANEIGTDTDTIATMAGALLGACDAATEPPENPLDSDYLLREADRLVAISQGGTTAGHSYPGHPDLDRPAGPSGRTGTGRRPTGSGRSRRGDRACCRGVVDTQQGLRLAMGQNRVRADTSHQAPPGIGIAERWECSRLTIGGENCNSTRSTSRIHEGSQ